MNGSRIGLLRHLGHTPPGWEDVAGDHPSREGEHAEIAAATREWLRERGLTEVPREQYRPILPATDRWKRWNGTNSKEAS